MKNILKFIPILLLFVACSQEPIFWAIAQEIELEEPNVIGNINSIVKLKGNLYTQNGNVYKKDLNTIRGWTKIDAPGRVVALASDDNYLYALVAGQTDDEGLTHAYSLHASNGGNGNWAKIKESSSAIVLFDNGVIGDDVNTTGRNAYARIDGTVYLLSGTTTTEQASTGENAVAAANLGGTDHFSNTRAFCSDGTDTLYSVRDGKVKTSSTNADDSWVDFSVSITDATVMVYAKDRLYVGTEEGLEQVTLDAEGGNPTSVSNLDSNAEATTGDMQITSIGYFDDTDGNAIYAGAIEQYSTNDNGLWGYYPSRGNWNFE